MAKESLILEFQTKNADKVQRELDKYNKSVGRAEKQSSSMFKSMFASQVAFGAMSKGLSMLTNSIVAIGKASFKTSVQFEQYTVAFETMLGDAEKAQEVLQEIEDFSAATPFQLDSLVDGSRKLIAFGIGADEVVDKMRNLGNAASGNEEVLNRLVDSYGQIRIKGRASLIQLNRFASAGVPIMDALAQSLNVTNEEVFKLVSSGKVGFKEVDDAIKLLTTNGGKFAGMIEKQSTTLGGLISTMKDNVNLLGKSLIDETTPALKEMTSSAIKGLQKLRTFTTSQSKAEAVAKGMINTVSELTTAYNDYEKALKDLNKVQGDNLDLSRLTAEVNRDLAKINIDEKFADITKQFEKYQFEILKFKSSGLNKHIRDTNSELKTLNNIMQQHNGTLESEGKSVNRIINSLKNQNFRKYLKELVPDINKIGIKDEFLAFLNDAKRDQLKFNTVLVASNKQFNDMRLKSLEAEKAVNEMAKKMAMGIKEGIIPLQDINVLHGVLQEKIRGYLDLLEEEAKKNKELQAEKDKLAKEEEARLKALEEAKNPLIEQMEKELEVISRTSKYYNDLGIEYDDVIEKSDAFNEILNQGVTSLELSDEKVQKFIDTYKNLKVEEIPEAIKGINDAVSDNSEYIEDATKENEKFQAVISKGFESTGNELADSLNNIYKSAEDTVNQIFQFMDEINKKGKASAEDIAGFGLAMATVAMETAKAIMNTIDVALKQNTESQLESLEKAKQAELAQFNDTEEKKSETSRKKIEELLEMQKKATTAEEKIKLQKQIKDEEIARKELLNEEENERKKAAIEAKYARQEYMLRKKQFEIEKGMKIANVWMNAGIGITGAWAQSLSQGGVFGIPVAGVLTGMMTALAAAQTGVIASQKMPNFEMGGITNGMPSIVGERGQEIIDTPVGARVYSHTRTREIMREDKKEMVINNNTYLDSELIMSTITRKTLDNRYYRGLN